MDPELLALIQRLGMARQDATSVATPRQRPVAPQPPPPQASISPDNRTGLQRLIQGINHGISQSLPGRMWTAAAESPVGRFVGLSLDPNQMLASIGPMKVVKNPFGSRATGDAWLVMDDAGEHVAKAATQNGAYLARRRLGEARPVPESRPVFREQPFATERGGIRVDGIEFQSEVGNLRATRNTPNGDWWVYDPEVVEFGLSPNGNPVLRRKGVPRDQRQVRLDDVMKDPEAYGLQRFRTIQEVRDAIKVGAADMVGG